MDTTVKMLRCYMLRCCNISSVSRPVSVISASSQGSTTSQRGFVTPNSDAKPGRCSREVQSHKIRLYMQADSK